MLLNAADKVLLGATPVDKVYAGTTQVWPRLDIGGGGRFDPTSITDLLAWFDATQITGASDGDPLATWADSSPNGHDAGAVTVSPLYRTAALGGNPAVQFGAAGITQMSWSPGHAVADRTLFQVVQVAVGGQRGAYHTTQLQSDYPYLQTYGPGSGTVHTYTTPDLDSGVPWSGTTQFITLWADSGTGWMGLEVDGTQVTNTWSVAASSASFAIGGWPPGGYGMNGYIGELLIYERALGLVERAQVQDYLAAKWGP